MYYHAGLSIRVVIVFCFPHHRALGGLLRKTITSAIVRLRMISTAIGFAKLISSAIGFLIRRLIVLTGWQRTGLVGQFDFVAVSHGRTRDVPVCFQTTHDARDSTRL